jgi:hypothetical protein
MQGRMSGGSLLKELRDRNVQRAFICPHRSQQNFAESYIGRITVMESFGVVFAGAPLLMWVHAIKAAAFINNITATFYSKTGVWATPYELVHGSVFPTLRWWSLLGVEPLSCWMKLSKLSSKAGVR